MGVLHIIFSSVHCLKTKYRKSNIYFYSNIIFLFFIDFLFILSKFEDKNKLKGQKFFVLSLMKIIIL